MNSCSVVYDWFKLGHVIGLVVWNLSKNRTSALVIRSKKNPHLLIDLYTMIIPFKLISNVAKAFWKPLTLPGLLQCGLISLLNTYDDTDEEDTKRKRLKRGTFRENLSTCLELLTYVVRFHSRYTDPGHLKVYCVVAGDTWAGCIAFYCVRNVTDPQKDLESSEE